MLTVPSIKIFLVDRSVSFCYRCCMELRPYQTNLLNDIYSAWRHATNVLAVAPTGSGKTVLFAETIRQHNGASCAIAHRQELVGQISMALARCGVRHRIIGPKNVIRWIIQAQIMEFGRDYYDPSARCAVAGVDTIIKRENELKQWANQVTLWVQDEAHHLLTKNKWGKAVGMFPHAQGLGVTATPCRADGMGLGRHHDGVFDEMVEGPQMRWLIDSGYLTDYRVICPPSDLDLSTVKTGADGDLVRKQLATATKQSSIMGDVISHYRRHAEGLLGVTFAPDVETATELSARYNAARVPAEIVSAKTPGPIRMEILRRFRRRELLQLVNVDLFGEGFDLPAIEVVSMGRATQSYALYAQQFGRALRIMDGKKHALILDHTGNVLRHGLPDKHRIWSMDRREKRTKNEQPDDVIPLRVCTGCMAPYERVLRACPYCGIAPQPAARSAPEFVDGDLCELSPDVLAVMRGDIGKIDRPAADVLRSMQSAGMAYPVAKGAANQHERRQKAQAILRESIAWWAGYQRAAGRPDSESYRRFYHTFGIDVLSAQALGRPEAEALTERVNVNIARLMGVTS